MDGVLAVFRMVPHILHSFLGCASRPGARDDTPWAAHLVLPQVQQTALVRASGPVARAFILGQVLVRFLQDALGEDHNVETLRGSQSVLQNVQQSCVVHPMHARHHLAHLSLQCGDAIAIGAFGGDNGGQFPPTFSNDCP